MVLAEVHQVPDRLRRGRQSSCQFRPCLQDLTPFDIGQPLLVRPHVDIDRGAEQAVGMFLRPPVAAVRLPPHAECNPVHGLALAPCFEGQVAVDHVAHVRAQHTSLLVVERGQRLLHLPRLAGARQVVWIHPAGHCNPQTGNRPETDRLPDVDGRKAGSFLSEYTKDRPFHILIAASSIRPAESP